MSGLTHHSDLLNILLAFFFWIDSSKSPQEVIFFFAVVDLVWAIYIKSYYVA